ncbi:TonB-dependent receptor [Sphingobium sp. EM0848]|uniref:TonB-dependent receptor n=1 Tax=Sphingobium sp. EM0848 TaxID=2743473 RepID=UPI00159CAEDF|nr:TonB-dependent receptor [Sphingobium sp. EM0848]
MPGTKYLMTVSCVAIAIAALSTVAQAQEQAASSAQQTPTADQDADGGVGDIVVTAQRRSESINKVPLSIQAFGGDTLAKAGVTDAAGISQMVPAFNFSRSSANTPIYTVRGIGFNTPNLSATSPVGIYVDEVAYAYPYMSNGPSYDIERVEVLKGPQGTLYGRNTTGGLVNFITAKPTRDFHAGLTAEVGNYETINFEGFVSGPLTDTLSIRVAGRWDTADRGWQRNVNVPGQRLGEKDRMGGRVTLLWEPTDRLTVTLGGSFWKDNSDTIAVQAVAFNPDSAPFVAPGLASQIHTNWKAGEASWGPSYPAKPAYKADSSFWSATGRIDYELSDALTFTSLSGYSDVKRHDMNDVDGTTFEPSEYLSDGRIRSFSQELRLTGETGPVNWIVGGYFSRDKIRDDQIGYYRDSSILNTLAFLGQTVPQTTYTASQIANGFNTFRNLSSQVSRSLSAFANADWAISDQMKISGGVRYSDDKLDFKGCSADHDNNTAPVWNTGVAAIVAARTGRPFANPGIGPNQCLTYKADFSGPAGLVSNQLKQDNVSGRLALTWTPNSHTLAYASVSRGYKSGAFPVVAANVVTQLVPARQEKVTAYEAGVKLGLFDRLVQFNAAGFFYDYRDKQVFGEILDPIFVSLTRIVNIPKSEVYGAETDITISPTRELLLKFGASYTHTKVTEFTGFNRFGQAQDFAGSAFPFTPKYQLNALVSYDLPINDDLAIQFGANGNYQGKTVGSLDEDPVFDVKAYTIVNANIALHRQDDRWSIGLYARNLFNENYYTATDILTDTSIRVPGMVRTYGLVASFKY